MRTEKGQGKREDRANRRRKRGRQGEFSDSPSLFPLILSVQNEFRTELGSESSHLKTLPINSGRRVGWFWLAWFGLVFSDLDLVLDDLIDLESFWA